MKRSILLVAALLALTLTLTGVGQAAEVLQQTQTRLRAVHAAPNTPTVDVAVDGSVAFPGLAFPAVASYADFSSGGHRISVLPAGEQQATPLLETTADLAANTDHTLVVVGRPNELEPLLLQDDNSAPPPGQARLRFVHTSPDAPAVDVAITGGPVLFSDIAYKEVGDYITRTAGTVDLEVREAGTNNVLLPLPNLPLNNCSVYTLFLMGLREGQPPLQGVLSLDAITDCVPGTPAALRATATARPTSIVIIIFVFQGRLVVIRPGVTPATPTQTNTPSATPTQTPSPTGSRTPTDTPVPTGTGTPVTPSATPVSTATAVATVEPTSAPPTVETSVPPSVETSVPTVEQPTMPATSPPEMESTEQVPPTLGMEPSPGA